MNGPHRPVPDNGSSGGEIPGDRPGRVLAGRYELGQLLGTGGMAEVYAATDHRLGRTVAVKVLRPELARDGRVRIRFRREARSAASLNHPSVVAVHDTGDDTAEPFIVMEHVVGYTLRDILHRGQPMPLDQALGITAGLLTALEYAHRAGIVHRDIKPGNIMITPDGAVKVMDFGIARALDDDVTITQTVVGTPAYLSPEHAEGIPVDERSDLYSTGCVLFELLTGRPPFVAESAYVVAVQHLQEAPPVPSTLNPALPAALDRIVAKALVKDREIRYQTAAQFRDDLAAVRTVGTTDAPSVPTESRADTTDPIVLNATARMPSPPPAGTSLVASLPPTTGDLSRSLATAPPTTAPPTASGPTSATISPDAHHPDAQRAHWSTAASGGSRRRRRWPWVAVTALLVVGGMAAALIRYDGTGADRAGKPWDVFDPSTVSSPSATELKNSVVAVDTTGSVTMLDTDSEVRVLDSAGTVKPWVEP